MHIEHVAFNVPAPAAMADWYARHLGMRVVRRLDGPTQAHFIMDAGGRVVLEIYNNPAAPIPDYRAQDPLVFHIAFAVDDLEAESARLVAAGASVAEAPKQTPAGDRLTMLKDPWGVAIQLVARAQPII